MFLYCFREREYILDIFELFSGQRMMTTYIRPGGLWRDVPVEFEAAVRDFLKIFPKRIDEYEALLTKNPLLLDRMLGIGKLTGEECLNLWRDRPDAARFAAWTGICARRVRIRAMNNMISMCRPAPKGISMPAYLVRIEEMRQSLKIIEQALNKLPMGPVRSNNRKFVPPPRSEIGVSMEALIHHFKLWTEGFPAPKASIYSAVESPRGELGVYLEGGWRSQAVPRPLAHAFIR